MPPSSLRLPDPAGLDRLWLASYPPGVPASYPYPSVPATRLLDDAAADFPETVAVDCFGYRLSYRALLDRVDRFATALDHLGVGKGDRVSTVLPNCPQQVVVLFAAWRLGAVVALHDPHPRASQLLDQSNDARSSLLVTTAAAYPEVAALRARLLGVRHLVVTGMEDALPFPQNALLPLTRRSLRGYRHVRRAEGVQRYTDLVHRFLPAAPQAPVDPPRDVAVICHGPRGSTGLTHANLVAGAFQSRLWIPDTKAGQETFLCTAPFTDPYGLSTAMLAGVLAAATLVLLPRADRDRVVRALHRRRPTVLPGRQADTAAVAHAPVRRRDLGSLRTCLTADGPSAPDVQRRFGQRTGARLRAGYAVPGATGLTHVNPVYGRTKAGSVGLPLPDTVCALLDDEGHQVPPGAPGFLAVAGPQVPGPWIVTTTRAVMDMEGYLTLER